MRKRNWVYPWMYTAAGVVLLPSIALLIPDRISLNAGSPLPFAEPQLSNTVPLPQLQIQAAAALAEALPPSIIGRRARITFPQSGYVVEHEYLTANSLRWTLVEAPEPPERRQAEQTIVARQVGSNLVMLNWVEYNGTSVTEVIDTANGKVWAYWTYADDQATTSGGRAGMFEEGSFQFIDGSPSP